MTNWQTVGHLHIKRVLDAQLLSGRLANAYLFQGPEGVGKLAVAQEFAERLSPSPGNRIYFDLVTNGSIEQVRELLQLTSLTANGGGYKVVIIDGFADASHAVSNALLKTLEEPPKRTIFLLLSNSGAVLPTIQSRCVTLRFAKLTDPEMLLFAQQVQLAATPAALAFAAGTPRRLQQYLSGDETTLALAELVQRLEEICQQSPGKRLVFLQELAEYDTDLLKQLIVNWIAVLRHRLQQAIGVYAAISVAQETLKRLSMNANKKLSLEYLLLNTKL